MAGKSSGGSGSSTGSVTSSSSDGVPEGTLSTGSETTQEPGNLEGTLGAGSGKPDVTLRVEGDRGIRFSGICTVGKEQTVLTGEVPKQFTYHLEDQKLSCRIQKQDSKNETKNESLRVILLAGDTTRSVQQTNSSRGIINVSYAAS